MFDNFDPPTLREKRAISRLVSPPWFMYHKRLPRRIQFAMDGTLCLPFVPGSLEHRMRKLFEATRPRESMGREIYRTNFLLIKEFWKMSREFSAEELLMAKIPYPFHHVGEMRTRDKQKAWKHSVAYKRLWIEFDYWIDQMFPFYLVTDFAPFCLIEEMTGQLAICEPTIAGQLTLART